jgi:hypothetical protein
MARLETITRSRLAKWGICTITIGYSDSFRRSPHTNPESLPPNAHAISGTQGGDYRRPLQTVNSKNENSDPALPATSPEQGHRGKLRRIAAS